MLYRTMGLLHVRVLQALREERGQGTVEYVGVMLLLASVLTAVVAMAKGKDFEMTRIITDEVKGAIGKVSPGGG